jgi:hypothetical protein
MCDDLEPGVQYPRLRANVFICRPLVETRFFFVMMDGAMDMDAMAMVPAAVCPGRGR